jgi:hypothetical protein
LSSPNSILPVSLQPIMSPLWGQVREWRKVCSLMKSERNNAEEDATSLLLQRMSVLQDSVSELQREMRAAASANRKFQARVLSRLEQRVGVGMPMGTRTGTGTGTGMDEDLDNSSSTFQATVSRKLPAVAL